jgi:hypothetical protein
VPARTLARLAGQLDDRICRLDLDDPGDHGSPSGGR